MIAACGVGRSFQQRKPSFAASEKSHHQTELEAGLNRHITDDRSSPRPEIFSEDMKTVQIGGATIEQQRLQRAAALSPTRFWPRTPTRHPFGHFALSPLPHAALLVSPLSLAQRALDEGYWSITLLPYRKPGLLTSRVGGQDTRHDERFTGPISAIFDICQVSFDNCIHILD